MRHFSHTLITLLMLTCSHISAGEKKMDHAQNNPDVFFFEGFEDSTYTTHFTDIARLDRWRIGNGKNRSEVP